MTKAIYTPDRKSSFGLTPVSTLPTSLVEKSGVLSANRIAFNSHVIILQKSFMLSYFQGIVRVYGFNIAN